MLILLAILFFLLLSPLHALATMSVGAAGVSNSAFNASLSITYTGTAAGRGMVCGLVWIGNGSTVSSGTIGSDSFTLVGTPSYNATGNLNTQIAYVSSMSGSGSQTVSFSWSNTGSIYGVCQETYDTVGGAITIDGVANNQGTSANPSLTVTTGASGSIVIGVLETGYGGGSTGVGFTTIKNQAVINNEYSEYEVMGAAGSQSVSWTTGSSWWTAAASGFKASGGGGGSSVPCAITLLGVGKC